ncbi:MAG TPA: PAS domain S-box protein [Thermoanaerobaculia bacterium]
MPKKARLIAERTAPGPPVAAIADYGLSVFLEAAPDAIVVVDETGLITRTNRLAETMFGYPPGGMLGQPIEVLVPERFRKTHVTDRSRYLHEPRTRPMGAGQALTGVRLDGSEFPVEISLSPLTTSAGTHVISIVRDLTERARAEQKFRGFLESAPDAVVVIDRQGRIAIVNSLTESMFGYKREELLGQPVEILVPERYREQHVGDRDRYSQAPRKRPMGLGRELLGRRKDGTEFPVEISLSPLETEQGPLVTSIVRDTTESRETERRITASLREKEALLKEIHHRVKNNLQVISSLLRLQERNIEEPRIRQLFAESQQRIQSMALVHEKLYRAGDLARIDFSDYARSLSALLLSAFGLANGPVALHVIAPEPVFLSVDTAVPCGLILNELVTNSLKHAFPAERSGEIRVSVTCHDGEVALSVSDNGVGADSERIERSETLGLRLVKTLVRQLDGKLEISAQEGLAFRVTFREEKREQT